MLAAVAGCLAWSAPSRAIEPRRGTPTMRASSDAAAVIRRGDGCLSCWGCVSKCGACCYLAPSERPGVYDWLSSKSDRETYESMVGPDGWCVHFDRTSRTCTIYHDRPHFCRVDSTDWAEKLLGYGEAPSNKVGRAARTACREWIGSVYGDRSDEIRRYNAQMRAIDREDGEHRRRERIAAGGRRRGRRKRGRRHGAPAVETAAPN